MIQHTKASYASISVIHLILSGVGYDPPFCMRLLEWRFPWLFHTCGRPYKAALAVGLHHHRQSSICRAGVSVHHSSDCACQGCWSLRLPRFCASYSSPRSVSVLRSSCYSHWSYGPISLEDSSNPHRSAKTECCYDDRHHGI